MVIVTIQGSSGSVVRFASFLPFATLVRDAVELRFEDACPCHAQCAPSVAATLPPPAAEPALLEFEVEYHVEGVRGYTAVWAVCEAHARDIFVAWAHSDHHFLAAWPLAEATPAPATLRSR
jgi:hypothetical protein